MSNASTSVASSSCRLVRRHLISGVTVASAGMLALSLVAIPPGFDVARTGVRAVRLAAFAVLPPAQWRVLEEFGNNQLQTAMRVTKQVAGNASDIPAAVVNVPTADLTSPLQFDPATSRQPADAAAPAAPATALALPPIPAPLLPIIGPIILFGPLIALVILACPPCALFNFLTFAIPSFFIPFAPLSAVTAASVAPDEAITASAPSFASDPQVGDPTRVTTTTAETSDAAPVSGTRDEDASPATTVTPIDTEQVSLTEPATESESEQMSTDTATSTEDEAEVVDTDEAAQDSTTASDSGSTTSATASEPVSRTAIDGGKDASAESSSVASSSAASSATDSKSSGDDSSGGDDGSS